MLKQFISKQNIQHNEVIKINLSVEQYNVLLEVLTSTITKLGKENYYQRDQLKFYRTKNTELKIENDKLKNRLNLIYSKKDSPIPF